MYFNDTCPARAILKCEPPQETEQLMRTIANFVKSGYNMDWNW